VEDPDAGLGGCQRAAQPQGPKSSYPNPLEDAFVLFEEGREKEAMAMAEQFRPEKSAA
jgi:hypothetical protein